MCCNPKVSSCTDLKKIHDLYQLNGVPKGISIVHFCHMNGIVYKHYERWSKNYHNAKVIPVELVDRDELSESFSSEVQPVSAFISDSPIASFDILSVMVCISMMNS